MAGSVSGWAVFLELGPSPLSSLLLASFGLLSGREHCLHCPLVEERGQNMSCYCSCPQCCRVCSCLSALMWTWTIVWVPGYSCHSTRPSWGVGGVIVTRVWRWGGGRALGNAGKLNGPANYTTNRCLTFKRREKQKIAKDGWMMTNTQTSWALPSPPQKARSFSLTISEFPLLFSFLWGGMGRWGASLFPSLRRRERSEFHCSKLDGGRKGGMTAFSLSLGSRVKGAPLLSWGRWKMTTVLLIITINSNSYSTDWNCFKVQTLNL